MAEQPPFRQGQSFSTQLSPLEDLMFRGWVQQNNVPFNPNSQGDTDYDMRGYWRGLQQGHPMARPSEVNANDGRPHYPDYYKTPLHQTFSSESQWAGEGAPQWINDHQLATPSARITYDERQPLMRLLMGR
jgi:hypothetical protein